MASKEETTEAPVKKYTRAEVSQHNNLKETWLIIHNNVYDVTNFLNEVIRCFFSFFYFIFYLQSNLREKILFKKCYYYNVRIKITNFI